MKLYIPTCTLNFNNILSSESISPIGFYQRRGFGNKRFYPVCANNKEEAILLYSKYPIYNVEDDDLENYPMVIEIESNDYKYGYFEEVNEYEDVKTYACYQTINLNPFHCKIYFNNYTTWQGVLSKAEQSLENKFYKLYSANIEVKPIVKKSIWGYTKDFFTATEQDYFSWTNSFSECELKHDLSKVNHDIIIDRIKGFIYCYLIGANQSVSTNVGRLKAISRKLRNTLSAVVNSPDKRPTQMQDDAILAGINEFNTIYTSIDEDSIYNKSLLEAKLADNPLNLSSENAELLLKHWGIYDSFCRKIHLRKTYDAREIWTCLDSFSTESLNRVTENMSIAVRRLEAKEISQRKKFTLQSLMSVDENFLVQIKDDSYNHKFYQKLINSQINGDYKIVMKKLCVEESLALAYNGGKILMEMLGEEWETNPVSGYIQSLLNHFQENTSFDLFSSDVDVLVSFAAFCQKGDNIDRLVDYLVQTGFSNYKLAYGLYGATRGFASLPKTFTSTLINGNKEYYESVAHYVWFLLNGIDLSNAALPRQNTTTSATVENQLSSKIIENIDTIEPQKRKQEKVIEAVSKAVELEDAVQSPKAFMYILDSFPRIKSTNAYKALEAVNFAEDKGNYTLEQFRAKIYSIIGREALKGQKEKIDKAIELESKRQNPEAFLNILDNFLKPTDTAYKRIVTLFHDLTTNIDTLYSPDNTAILKEKTVNERRLRPISPTSNKFVEDDNVSNFILSRKYLPDFVRGILAKKVCSFQKSYQPGGRNYSRPLDYPSDNKSTIDHFKHWCFYDKGGYPPILERTTDNERLFEQLTQDLLNRYANK